MADLEETKYDEKQAKVTERAYQTPEITAQRVATLKALGLRAGESVLDIGVGPGLLSFDMAHQVGESGRVVGVDKAAAMLNLARGRCGGLPQVEIKRCDALNLEFDDVSFDAAVCTQVLLYVDDVAKALAEMHRVVRPGGRAVIIETDWRGLVLGSSFSSTTEKMIQNWDAVVASPQLPPALQPMLTTAGFRAITVTAVPVVLNNCLPGGYAYSMLKQFHDSAIERKQLGTSEAGKWFGDLERRNGEGSFFFCINRFLFTAVRI